MSTQTTKIRPSGRLISTIGEDLISDIYAAVVEIVKNSYDADANKVDILFRYTTINNEPAIKIEIEDDGHGMSQDIVLNSWLVPATNNKLTEEKVRKDEIFKGERELADMLLLS